VRQQGLSNIAALGVSPLPQLEDWRPDNEGFLGEFLETIRRIRLE
jgi:hypothetical protein